VVKVLLQNMTKDSDILTIKDSRSQDEINRQHTMTNKKYMSMLLKSLS